MRELGLITMNDYLELEEYVGNTFKIELTKGEKFSKAKIVTLNKAQGVKAVFGYRGEFDSEIYAYIFNKDLWTDKEAKAWIAAHKNDSLNDLVLFGKLEVQEKKNDEKRADNALFEKLEKQAEVKELVSHADSIGMKGNVIEGDAWTENTKGVTFHDVPFTKEMVQEYSNGKHYKPAEELKKAMDSLRGKPVTAYQHPAEKVVTTMEQQVGYIVFDSVKWDDKGKRPYGDVFIKKNEKNKQLIKDTKEKKLEDVSVGFRCAEVNSPGVFNGEPYDIRQENFFFDHLSLVQLGRASTADGVGLNAF